MWLKTLKKDWDNEKKRWEAWWQCEVYDRPIIMVTAPKDNPDGYIPYKTLPNGSLEEQWLNVDYKIEGTLGGIHGTYFGGEALPVFYHGFAVGNAFLYGCEPIFDPNTIWVDPIPVEEDGYPLIECNFSGKWWKWLLETVDKAARSCEGRYFIYPQWGNNAGDTLANIRGTEQLMIDIAENPEWVKESVKKISDDQIKILNKLWNLLCICGIQGTANYCGTWSPYKTLAFDCDVSCMISTEMFKEIFLIPLLEQMSTVEHRIYHLDGTGAFHHLDTLLGLDELHAIQFGPGEGREEILQWIPLIKHIQEKKKAVIIYPDNNEKIPAILKELSPEGLCISTECKTETEAKKLVEQISDYYR